MKKNVLLLTCIVTVLLTTIVSSGFAASNDELERRLDLVTQELQKLRNELVVEETESKSQYGFGKSASKVYHLNKGLSIGGYGEGRFKNYTSDKGAKLDRAEMLRAILYVGYKFNDTIVFNSEIEFEHANEAFVEMASLDFLLHENINLRAGLLLAPMGLTNELHEPTLFHGNDRPLVENQVIPTTWREMAAGVFGKLTNEVDYKLYVMNGFDGADFTSKGLRGGRQKGSKANADDWALVGRLDYEPVLGFNLGGSFYLGDSGQRRVLDAFNGNEVDVFTQIYEIHTQYKYKGLELKGLLSQVKIDDAELIGSYDNVGVFTGANVPDEVVGYYGEVAYDFMPHILKGTDQYLAPFVRYEDLNYVGNNEDVTLMVFGLTYKPIPNVVIKADYSNFEMDDPTQTRADELNVGLGYIF
jgi:hypothetical protein